jgi:hypothetical protein
MAVDGADLVSELKSLRKGRAVYVRRIAERVGPALTLVCGISADDSPAEIRTKVSERLESLAGELPEDLRIAVLAAFSIHRDARQPFYQDRVRWVASRLGRDERTARRRIDEGIERLAELAITPAVHRGPDTQVHVPRWYTEELLVALLVDRPALEALEFRRVVADQDGLGELDLALTLTVAPGEQRMPAESADLHVDVVYGGTLVPGRQESSDRFGYLLELPKPIDRFARHEYALRYRPRPDVPAQPHYACVLKQRCDVFDLRARFGRVRPPRRIWRLNGAFQRDLDDPVLRGEPLSLDPAGELHIMFRHLTPGLAYGFAGRSERGWMARRNTHGVCDRPSNRAIQPSRPPAK